MAKRKTNRVYVYGYEGYKKQYAERVAKIQSKGITDIRPMFTKEQFETQYKIQKDEYINMGKKPGNIIRDLVYEYTTEISYKHARAISSMYEELRNINSDLPEKKPSIFEISVGKLGKKVTFKDVINDAYFEYKKKNIGKKTAEIWNELLTEMNYGGDSLYAN